MNDVLAWVGIGAAALVALALIVAAGYGVDELLRLTEPPEAQNDVPNDTKPTEKPRAPVR